MCHFVAFSVFCNLMMHLSSVSQLMFGHNSFFSSFVVYFTILISPTALYEGLLSPIDFVNVVLLSNMSDC